MWVLLARSCTRIVSTTATDRGFITILYTVVFSSVRHSFQFLCFSKLREIKNVRKTYVRFELDLYACIPCARVVSMCAGVYKCVEKWQRKGICIRVCVYIYIPLETFSFLFLRNFLSEMFCRCFAEHRRISLPRLRQTQSAKVGVNSLFSSSFNNRHRSRRTRFATHTYTHIYTHIPTYTRTCTRIRIDPWKATCTRASKRERE